VQILSKHASIAQQAHQVARPSHVHTQLLLIPRIYKSTLGPGSQKIDSNLSSLLPFAHTFPTLSQHTMAEANFYKFVPHLLSSETTTLTMICTRSQEARVSSTCVSDGEPSHTGADSILCSCTLDRLPIPPPMLAPCRFTRPPATSLTIPRYVNVTIRYSIHRGITFRYPRSTRPISLVFVHSAISTPASVTLHS
jgi:hypothetical protein